MRRMMILVAIISPLLVAGCATKADVEALRKEVIKSQEMAADAKAAAEAAATKADGAAAASRQSAAESKAASDKADQVFRQSLRK